MQAQTEARRPAKVIASTASVLSGRRRQSHRDLTTTALMVLLEVMKTCVVGPAATKQSLSEQSA